MSFSFSVKIGRTALFSEVPLRFLSSLIMFMFISLLGLKARASSATLTHTVLGTSTDFSLKAWELSSTALDERLLLDVRQGGGFSFHEEYKTEKYLMGSKFSSLISKPVLRVGTFGREFRGEKVSVFNGSLKGDGVVREKFTYSYSLGYLTFAEEYQNTFTIGEILRGQFAGAGGSYRIGEKWRSTFNFQHFFLNDDNTRLNHDLGIFYGISTGDPWIWIGVGASRMSNSDFERPYWAPLEFYNVGPRLDLSFSVREKFRFSSGLNLNYFNDVKSGDGIGYYSMTRVSYRLSPSFDAVASLESIQSQQAGNTWKGYSSSVGLKGNW